MIKNIFTKYLLRKQNSILSESHKKNAQKEKLTLQ